MTSHGKRSDGKKGDELDSMVAPIGAAALEPERITAPERSVKRR